MRFHCDQCRTRYVIPDEKIRGKALKIRCKNCGNVMTVTDQSRAAKARATGRARSAAGRRTADMAGRQPIRAQRSSRPAPKPDGARPAGGSASSLAADSGYRGLAEPPTEPAVGAVPSSLDAPTVISDPNIDLAQLQNLPLDRGPAADGEPEEWYLADDVGEYGPMSFDALGEKFRRGEAGLDAQVWRDGFEDWLDVADVPELRPMLKRRTGRPVAGMRTRRGLGPSEPAPAARESAAFSVAYDSARPGLPETSVPDSAPRAEASRSPEAAREIEEARESHRALKKLASDTARKLKALDRPIAADAFQQPAEEAGEEGEGPIPATDFGLPESPPMGDNILPAVVPESRDKSHSLGIIFAVLGGVVALTLIVLVVFLILRESDKAKTGKAEKVKVAHANTRPEPKNNNNPSPQPDAGLTAAAGGGADGSTEEEELVMPAVEISLSKKSTRPGGRKHSRGDSGRESRDSGFSPGSGIYGSFGTGRIGHSRKILPTPTRPRGRGEKIGSGSHKVTQSEILRVVRRNVHRLKFCYEKAVRLHPTALRRVKMKITIRVGSSGRVKRVTIVPGKYRGMSLGSCLVRSIRSWKFPSSTKSYGTRFPVSFIGR